MTAYQFANNFASDLKRSVYSIQDAGWNLGLDAGLHLINKYGKYIEPVITSAYNKLSGKTESGYQQNFLNQQMAFNEQQAEINREFQREMSNTAYQRMVEDLKKAGFNPALALGGGGSTTPAGSLATSSLATAPNVTASSTARFNNSVNALTQTFNNLMTNAFDMIKSYNKNMSDKTVALAKVLTASK